ncbi:MAG: acyl-CoA dehydrogenase family protein [Halieaceae bacterium]|nr:acyl-CoA dehydrogenase family protein [Halieaceae bacterium]
MTPYKAPLQDIFFSLREIAGAQRIPEWDEDLALEVASAFANFAENEIAPLNGRGDLQGCRIENGAVRMPDGFREAYQRLAADGWQGLSLPDEHGGQGLPNLLQFIVSEIFSGANHSLQMVVNLVPGASNVLTRFGTDEQRQTLIPLLASGSYLATMCLTESGAGSDLAKIRCKATPAGDNWEISGEKIFISGGGQDISDGILHLVLARTGEEGIRGLSLFACRSILENGSPNSISVARIEEKMGLHASPTCQMQFERAEAEIIGLPGEGLKCMFAMMNHARTDVALQGVAHATRALDIATAYAAERTQGTDDDGRSVSIDQHEDVRQMLDDMAALAIGGRAIAHTVLVHVESGSDAKLVDFLTPVAKAFCSEAATSAAYVGQQVLGGYGYLQEYGIDQIYRDARITAIYEGTNGIHAKTLLKRELSRGQGAEMFRELISDIVEATANEKLGVALTQWDDVKARLTEAQYPISAAGDFMQLTGKLLFLALWLRILDRVDRSSSPEMYGRVGKRVLKRVPLEISCLSSQIRIEIDNAVN